jgi:hypothetical protein
MKMNKNTKMCIGVIILIVIVVLVVQNKDKLVRKNNVVESFNPKSSNNISLDDIQKKLDELQGGN